MRKEIEKYPSKGPGAAKPSLPPTPPKVLFSSNSYFPFLALLLIDQDSPQDVFGPTSSRLRSIPPHQTFLPSRILQKKRMILSISFGPLPHTYVAHFAVSLQNIKLKLWLGKLKRQEIILWLPSNSYVSFIYFLIQKGIWHCPTPAAPLPRAWPSTTGCWVWAG